MGAGSAEIEITTVLMAEISVESTAYQLRGNSRLPVGSVISGLRDWNVTRPKPGRG
jgi:hypothetical protein